MKKIIGHLWLGVIAVMIALTGVTGCLLLADANKAHARGSGTTVFNNEGSTNPSLTSTGSSPANTAVQVAAGHELSFAIVSIKEKNEMFSWGRNSHGQLGIANGDIDNRNSPHRVANSHDWLKVSAGREFSLGINKSGELYAWGAYGSGQLGYPVPDIHNSTRNTPTRVGDKNNWVDVAAGAEHSLAVNSDGELWVWGENARGQLGLGNNTRYNTPQRVTNPAGTWKTVAAGTGHSFAINSAGQLFSWGRNDLGQLGLGHYTNRNIPTQITNPSRTWKAVDGGDAYSVAIDNNGLLFSWGHNGNGELGNGSIGSYTPTPAQRGSIIWEKISAGWFHSLGISQAGELYTWGYGGQGQLGRGNTSSSGVITKIGNGSYWHAIAGGEHHSLAVSDVGKIYSWGRNNRGQLGLRNNTNHTTPQLVRSPYFNVLNIEYSSGDVNAQGSKAGTTHAYDDTITWDSVYLDDAGIDPAFSNRGYDFDGYSVKIVNSISDGGTWNEGSRTVSQLTANLINDSDITIILSARWEPRQYDIEYSDKGGGNSLVNLLPGSDMIFHHKFGTTTTLPAPVGVPGYKFKGWFADIDCEGAPVTQISATQIPPGGEESLFTFYALWEVNTITLRFFSGGYEGEKASITYTYEDVIQWPTAPEFFREAHTLTGWEIKDVYLGSTNDWNGLEVQDGVRKPIDASSKTAVQITSAINTMDVIIDLTAIWGLNILRIEYLPDTWSPNTNTTGSKDDYWDYYNTNPLPQPEARDAGTMKNEYSTWSSNGWELSGWQVNGTTRRWMVNDTTVDMNFLTSNLILRGDQTIVLTPLWIAKTYNIIFKEENEKDLSNGNKIFDTYTFDKTFVLSPPPPFKRGYDFVGWYWDSTCLDAVPGNTIPAGMSPNENTHFAVFAKFKAQEFNIYYRDMLASSTPTKVWLAKRDENGDYLHKPGCDNPACIGGTTTTDPKCMIPDTDAAGISLVNTDSQSLEFGLPLKGYISSYVEGGDDFLIGDSINTKPTKHTYNTATTLPTAGEFDSLGNPIIGGEMWRNTLIDTGVVDLVAEQTNHPTATQYKFMGWYIRYNGVEGAFIELPGDKFIVSDLVPDPNGVGIDDGIVLYAKWGFGYSITYHHSDIPLAMVEKVENDNFLEYINDSDPNNQAPNNIAHTGIRLKNLEDIKDDKGMVLYYFQYWLRYDPILGWSSPAQTATFDAIPQAGTPDSIDFPYDNLHFRAVWHPGVSIVTYRYLNDVTGAMEKPYEYPFNGTIAEVPVEIVVSNSVTGEFRGMEYLVYEFDGWWLVNEKFIFGVTTLNQREVLLLAKFKVNIQPLVKLLEILDGLAPFTGPQVDVDALNIARYNAQTQIVNGSGYDQIDVKRHLDILDEAMRKLDVSINLDDLKEDSANKDDLLYLYNFLEEYNKGGLEYFDVPTLTEIDKWSSKARFMLYSSPNATQTEVDELVDDIKDFIDGIGMWSGGPPPAGEPISLPANSGTRERYARLAARVREYLDDTEFQSVRSRLEQLCAEVTNNTATNQDFRDWEDEISGIFKARSVPFDNDNMPVSKRAESPEIVRTKEMVELIAEYYHSSVVIAINKPLLKTDLEQIWAELKWPDLTKEDLRRHEVKLRAWGLLLKAADPSLELDSDGMPPSRDLFPENRQQLLEIAGVLATYLEDPDIIGAQRTQLQGYRSEALNPPLSGYTNKHARDLIKATAALAVQAEVGGAVDADGIVKKVYDIGTYNELQGMINILEEYLYLEPNSSTITAINNAKNDLLRGPSGLTKHEAKGHITALRNVSLSDNKVKTDDKGNPIPLYDTAKDRKMLFQLIDIMEEQLEQNLAGQSTNAINTFRNDYSRAQQLYENPAATSAQINDLIAEISNNIDKNWMRIEKDSGGYLPRENSAQRARLESIVNILTEYTDIHPQLAQPLEVSREYLASKYTTGMRMDRESEKLIALARELGITIETDTRGDHWPEPFGGKDHRKKLLEDLVSKAKRYWEGMPESDLKDDLEHEIYIAELFLERNNITGKELLDAYNRLENFRKSNNLDFDSYYKKPKDNTWIIVVAIITVVAVVAVIAAVPAYRIIKRRKTHKSQIEG